MKKKSVLLIVLSILVFVLCACSNQNDTKVQPDVKKIKDDIYKSVTLPEMMDCNTDNIAIMYDFDLSKFESYSISAAGSPVSAEEIAIIKVKNSSDVNSVKSVFETRKESRANIFSGYAPLEADKVKKSIIKTKGNYVFFAVCGEPDKAEKAFDDAFKQ